MESSTEFKFLIRRSRVSIDKIEVKDELESVSDYPKNLGVETKLNSNSEIKFLEITDVKSNSYSIYKDEVVYITDDGIVLLVVSPELDIDTNTLELLF